MESSLAFLFLPVLNRLSASDQISEVLREAIVRGDLPAGLVLRQDEIASRFNVSKIPVREALKRLEAEGLVSFARNRGAVVTSLSSEEIREYIDIRAMLEGRAAELAVANMRDESVAQARLMLDQFGAETHPSRWGHLNWAFHSALYVDAGRPILLSEIRSLYDKLDRYVRMLLAFTAEMPKTQREHEDILDAFARRDADAAASLTRHHVLDAGASLVKYLDDHRK